MVVVKVRGLDSLIRCADLVRCPLKPGNLVLVRCETQLSADPHPPMRGDWSIPEDLVVHFIRGDEVPEYERPGYVPHGPTPEPPREVPREHTNGVDEGKVIEMPVRPPAGDA